MNILQALLFTILFSIIGLQIVETRKMEQRLEKRIQKQAEAMTGYHNWLADVEYIAKGE